MYVIVNLKKSQNKYGNGDSGPPAALLDIHQELGDTRDKQGQGDCSNGQLSWIKFTFRLQIVKTRSSVIPPEKAENEGNRNLLRQTQRMHNRRQQLNQPLKKIGDLANPH